MLQRVNLRSASFITPKDLQFNEERNAKVLTSSTNVFLISVSKCQTIPIFINILEKDTVH